jgi:hypothetical protein
MISAASWIPPFEWIAPASQSRSMPRLGMRILVATLIGAVVAGAMFLFLSTRHHDVLAMDFTWSWRAARLLWHGGDPYKAIVATGRYPFDSPFRYPLTAAIVAMPLVPFSGHLAGAVFLGLSAGVLAFALSREDWYRLVLLLSGPSIAAFLSCQWALLLLAGALLSGIGCLLAAKPTLGAALFIYRPTWKAIAGGCVLLLGSLVWQPSWPREWIATSLQHGAPVYRLPLLTTWLGPFLLLSSLRWRTAEGRLLLAMSCVPQGFLFYDQLPLLLIPQNRTRLLVATFVSQAAFLGGHLYASHAAEFGVSIMPWAMAGCYVPALYFVLRPVRHSSVQAGRHQIQ